MATSQVASSVDVLHPTERLVVVRALTMLSASMRRAAKASHSDEVRAIQERDAAAVDALAVKFR